MMPINPYSHIIVYVDGVLQPRDDYAISDTHVHFRHAPDQFSSVDIRTQDGSCHYTGNGSNYEFRHNNGILARKRIDEIMQRALKHRSNDGVEDLLKQLDVLTRLLDE